MSKNSTLRQSFIFRIDAAGEDLSHLSALWKLFIADLCELSLRRRSKTCSTFRQNQKKEKKNTWIGDEKKVRNDPGYFTLEGEKEDSGISDCDPS